MSKPPVLTKISPRIKLKGGGYATHTIFLEHDDTHQESITLFGLCLEETPFVWRGPLFNSDGQKVATLFCQITANEHESRDDIWLTYEMASHSKHWSWVYNEDGVHAHFNGRFFPAKLRHTPQD